MSGHDEDASASKKAPVAAENQTAGGRDPRITPLGDNAGVHIRTEEEPDEVAIDFGGFVVSLGTSCLINLGQHKNPETGKREKDLDAARQLIHILEMLQKKTRGNLDEDEGQLLKSLLFDLRMAYVEATK